MDRYRDAREGNRNDAFRQDVLNLLERIAVALENSSPQTVKYENIEATLDSPKEPSYNRDATVCNCGNNPKKYCPHCTAARMGWIFNMNPGWTPT